MVIKITRCCFPQLRRGAEGSLSGGEFGDGLGALRDSVLSQFSREDEPNSSLNLA